MWSKPVALGLLAVAMYHGRGRGAPMSRVTPASKAPSSAPARQPTSKPVSRASGTDGARRPGCSAARLKPTQPDTPAPADAPAQPGKAKGYPAGPFVRRTHPSAG